MSEADHKRGCMVLPRHVAARFLALLLVLAAASPSQAVDDPSGDWLVAKRYAIIRIANCGGQIWGIVSWALRPELDKNNPDPSKRSRPTLGMPVILGMTMSKPQEWSGEIYNSRDGRTYDASISLSKPDVLHVEGCVLGVLCGGEDWTRVTRSTTGAPMDSPNAGLSSPETPEAICTRLTSAAGNAH